MRRWFQYSSPQCHIYGALQTAWSCPVRQLVVARPYLLFPQSTRICGASSAPIAKPSVAQRPLSQHLFQLLKTSQDPLSKAPDLPCLDMAEFPGLRHLKLRFDSTSICAHTTLQTTLAFRHCLVPLRRCLLRHTSTLFKHSIHKRKYWISVSTVMRALLNTSLEFQGVLSDTQTTPLVNFVRVGNVCPSMIGARNV